jgi:predicted secreted protein
MRLSQEDANSSWSVPVGEDVVVQLPERATTGHLWRPETDDSALQLVDDYPNASALPRGAPGTHTFVFRPLRPGPTVLRLVLARPWEKTPVEEFTVDLRVGG